MTARTSLAAVLLVVLLAGGVTLALAPSSHASFGLAAPLAREPGLAAPPAAPPLATPTAPAPAAATATPAAASGPSTDCGGTPSGAYNWATQNFFTDVSTTFWTPDSPSLSGGSFQPVPCTNVIPTFTNGFWINVTTNVPMTTAQVTIWGTGWPTASTPLPPIKGFDPSQPAVLNMYIEPPFYRTASFYFNDYRNFWPGSSVFFNVTLTSTNATPGTIYSASPLSGHYEKYQWSGGVDNASWAFYVASPFAEQPVGQTPVNFSNIIRVYTSPSVLSSPAFEPNPKQQVQVYLSSLNFSGSAAPPIPDAQGSFSLSGGVTGVYLDNFGPANHSVLQLLQPLGPYPGTQVKFNVTVWLPWEGGAIDYVYSKVYAFNWSANGGWWDPTAGLEGNLLLSTAPSLQGLGSTPTLSTGTPLNVTIHESTENVTISSAMLHYHYEDSTGSLAGALPMSAANQNTSYAVIPGLPPGGAVTFSVVAKDIYGEAIASGNYSYSESGPYATALPLGYGIFYFEAIDVATGQLVPTLNFTISNASWSEASVGYAYGFANPVIAGGHLALPVADGNYVVTVTAFGMSQTWVGAVSSQDPFVVVFYLSSSPVGPTYGAPLSSLSISGAVGLLGASITAIPVVQWFKERRRKAEAEQRRISL